MTFALREASAAEKQCLSRLYSQISNQCIHTSLSPFYSPTPSSDTTKTFDLIDPTPLCTVFLVQP